MGELQDRLSKLEEQLKPKENVKIKPLRLPWKAKVGNGKAKKGYVGVLKLNENMVIDPSKVQISEQTVDVDGLPRLATGEHIWKWKIGFKTYPVIIQPSWSVEPLSVKSLFKESIDNGSNIKGWKIIYNKMKSSVVETKKKQFPLWIAWIIGLVVIGGGAYALFTGKL
jgi:hypothetical protein